ncbi:MAG: glycosyltransferase family 2 protein [Candidatus Pacebacteria bacterium]|nr:glycosyltransferase family 2 protein [Candidatus Paceibacterota bacterium]PIR60682.1 MAG: hypothetical protein COU67_00970 [Candidatus Pacebacteria bacterium CG10_big_fil_rev_8_21_14_0_10_44_54]
MRVSILIVSYNTKELTLQTLQSVIASLSQSILLQNNSEIIVVDNNSRDESLAAIKQLATASAIPITLLANTKNTGFAHANNLAIAKATGKVLLLLNSDTLVPQGAITRLYERLMQSDSKHLGILAANLRNLDGSPQPQGGALPNLITLTNHMLMLDDLPLIGKFLPSTQNQKFQGWVAATAMAIKKSVIDEIGTLDENIFMYGEDVEFCLRARHHHWDVAISPDAVITHIQAASSNQKNAVLGEIKGYQYIWAKHMPLWQRPVVNTILRLGILLRWLLFATIGRTEQSRLYRSLLSQV